MASALASNPQQCPKCKGLMDQGFLLELGDGDRREVTVWIPGSPLSSFWGIKPKDPQIPVGVFRCTSCGFLEFYARDEFAPK
jgi:predicted nucleic-acid-binding Zn-ribbon protein